MGRWLGDYGTRPVASHPRRPARESFRRRSLTRTWIYEKVKSTRCPLELVSSCCGNHYFSWSIGHSLFNSPLGPQPDRWTEAKAWTVDAIWRDLPTVHLIHRSTYLLIHLSSDSGPRIQSDGENAGRRSAGTVDPGLAIRAHVRLIR